MKTALPPPLRPGRVIEGNSAVLLPFDNAGQPDLPAFQDLLQTTWKAGLTPAVNMDTGFVNLLSPAERTTVLHCTRELAHGRRFIAGVYVEDQSGSIDSIYGKGINEIVTQGGTPILFPSPALKQLTDQQVVEFHKRVGGHCPEFLAFELGEMFLPFGRIYSLDTFERLLDIPQLTGIKHSSLEREQEWQRLVIRDRRRADFRLYTGNDLAIDMVMYGSDYLLGLSGFHPEAFALRDRLWHTGEPQFHMLNDLLQYLGFFAFRAPVPAYKHSAAQFLNQRGVLQGSSTHPRGALRPATDVPILRDICERLDAMCARVAVPAHD